MDHVRYKKDKGYHKLILWTRLKEFLKIVYDLTELLPEREKFGLVSQMQRAIISVISNFVEGYLKRSIKEKLHFIEIAETSLMELEAQGEACFILSYWKDVDYHMFDSKRSEVAYLLYRYKINVK